MSSAKWRQFYLGLNVLTLVVHDSLHWRHNEGDGFTSLTIVNSTVYSGTNQRKHQSSASLAFVWGIHRWSVNSPHEGPVMRKRFPFDDVIMSLESVMVVFGFDARNICCKQFRGNTIYARFSASTRWLQVTRTEDPFTAETTTVPNRTFD